MKIKRVLREERKKIDERILAEGQDLYNELVEQYCTPKKDVATKSKKQHFKWIAAVSCVVLICLVVGLSVALTQPKPPQYLEQNAVRINSNIDELNSDTNSSIAFGNSYTINKITRIEDSETSDKLFYSIEFGHNDELIWGELYVVINNDYHFVERHVGEVQESKFNDYDMEYSAKEYLLDDIPMNEYFGCISLSKYKIYFSFEELRDKDSEFPQSVLDDLLILK